MKLEIKNLSYTYSGNDGVRNISLNISDGEFVGLIGANGSGKSTIIKNVSRALTPDSGEIFLDGVLLSSMSYKESAQKMAVVGQENDIPFDFSVREIVSMGRTPRKGFFEPDTSEDIEMVHHALVHLGMEHAENRSFKSLSGGEKQRVLLARALAQESNLFVLDEPTNHLDISYQLEIFDFIKRLRLSALSAMHDLNMAALYCDRIYALAKGEIVLCGTPDEVLTPENIFMLYGVHSSVCKNVETGKLSISYFPGYSKKGM